MEVKILHLYHDIMNLYGEYGNIKILEKHLKDQGFEVIVEKKSLEEEKNFEEYDFIYMGCGTEKNQKVILSDLIKDKEQFLKYIEEEKNMLLTGNSFEILGKKIDEEEALGLLNFNTKHQDKRITTDAICTSKIFNNKIVGFINTMSIIEDNENPLFEFDYSTYNLKDDGIIYKNVLGTHLIGPLLIRNPEILEYFIKKIAQIKGVEYKEIKYEEENEGYKLVLEELEKRKSLNN